MLYELNNNLLQGLLVIGVSVYLGCFYYILRKQFIFSDRALKIIVLAACASAIFLSITHPRKNSYDGHNAYEKMVVNLVNTNFNIEYLGIPQYPFLGELSLAVLYKALGREYYLIFFALTGIGFVFSAHLLFRELAIKKEIARFAVFLLVCNSVFAAMLLHEYKIDHFLGMLSNIFFILFIKVLKTGSLKYYLLAGVIGGAALLTKVTFGPILALCLAFGTIYKIKLQAKERPILIKKAVLELAKFSLTAIVVVFLVLLWTYKFGLYVGPNIYFYPQTQKIKPLALSTNKEVAAACNKEILAKDQGLFLPKYKFPLMQPIKVIFWSSLGEGRASNAISIARLETTMYLGVFSLSLWPLYMFVKKKPLGIAELLIIISSVYVWLFFLEVQTLIWYLIPVFSIIALIASSTTTALIKDGIIKTYLVFLILGTTTVSVIFLLSISFNGLKVSGTGEKTKQDPYITSGYDLVVNTSSTIDSVIGNNPGSYILDAALHPYFVFTTYTSNYYATITRNNLYFLENTDTDLMRDELISKNVRYILVSRANLLNTWYDGCAEENNRTLDKFLNKYTVPIFPLTRTPVLFKIL